MALPRRLRGFAVTLLAAGTMSACASVQMRDDVTRGLLPWAPAPGGSLGRLSIWPETDWRADQKEKPSREEMAQTAIAQAFKGFPHGEVAEIRPITAWNASTEPERLAEAKKAGLDTVVFVRVSELGPLLYLSIPVLWSTYSDVKFRLRLVSLDSGEVLLDAERHRQVGGPFALRGTEPLTAEMEIALRDALGLPAR
ncbi:hypothetical protein D3C87_637940 [compost metagenome]